MFVDDAPQEALQIWPHFLAWWMRTTGFGALTVVGFATPMLPVLFARAPVVFRIPPLVYLAASLLVLEWLVRGRAVSLDSRAGERSGGRHAP